MLLPRWFPPLARTHPTFFLLYTVLLIASLVSGVGCFVSGPSDFSAPALFYVAKVPPLGWAAGFTLASGLLVAGFHRFRLGQYGLAVGMVVWFSWFWLVQVTRLDDVKLSWPGTAALFAVAAVHLPLALEPPSNPETRRAPD